MVRRGKITEVRMAYSNAVYNCSIFCLQVVYPFNIGILANVTSTIGHTPIEWLFTGKAAGDGLSYPHAEGSGMYQIHN